MSNRHLECNPLMRSYVLQIKLRKQGQTVLKAARERERDTDREKGKKRTNINETNIR